MYLKVVAVLLIILFNNPENELVEEPIAAIEEPVVEELPEIDYEFEALVNTTFKLETGHGKSNLWVKHNNPGGIRCLEQPCTYDGWQIYETPEEGMNAMRTLLRKYYVDIFGMDLKAIRKKYCPPCSDKEFNEFKYMYDKELEELRCQN